MKIMIGDYVVLTRWCDMDNGDPWFVGFLSERGEDKKGKYYKCYENNRYYRHCKKISGEQGQLILEGAIIKEVLGRKK